jgi:uncharacterized membrane protein YfcA
MPEFTLILWMLLFGLLSGLLAGLLGVGGGLLLVPILEYALANQSIEGEELVRYTLANSFFAIIFAGLSSSYRQFKNQNFYLRPVLLTALPAIGSALLFAELITHYNWYRKEYFNVLFMGVLIFVLWRFMRKKSTSVAMGEMSPESVKPSKFLISGFFTGITSALSGLGGGIAMIPLFTEYIGMPIKKATSVSIGVIPLMMIPVSILYGFSKPLVQSGMFQWGYIVLPLSLSLISGIIIAAPIGVNMAHRMNSTKLQSIFAVLIVIIILRYIIDTIWHIG